MQQRDYLVVGGGAMGLATAWWLTRQGREVTVLEQFGRHHEQGSSHGGTRIFRLAYTDPDFVKLAQAALPLWRELEDEAQVRLLDLIGAVDHGPAAAIAPLISTMDSCGVTSEVLTSDEAALRWPGMRFDDVAVFHPGGGRIYARTTLDAFEQGACSRGADIRYDEPVESIGPSPRGLVVRTPLEEYEAGTVIVTAGAWVSKLLEGVIELPPLKITQEQTLHFRSLDPFEFWPPFIHRLIPEMYGVETPGEGVKVAEHGTGQVVDPDDRDFMVDPFAAERVCEYVRNWFPGLDPNPVTSATCLYTSTADANFILDKRGPLVVASPCSGHGFKFSPIIGKLVASLATDEAWPPLRFRLR
ncbi:MAG: FAD-dependent oxidoreductase [Acidimicrobiia bacterium]